MTTMDSDSASQDSDDGRRFRFEATRKDPVALVDTTSRTKTPKKSKHKSSHYESGRHYRDRKERLKHESDRKNKDDKDLRYSTKHSKHELRSSRQEDAKNTYKDHRENRDVSTGSVANDRSFRNSSGGDGRERLRDSKRQSDRDRSVHRMQRSREHSYERNHYDEQASNEKHRNRYHERHGRRSCDRSRDRSRQSSRAKSSNGDHRSREDGRHDFSRKTSIKENRSQDYLSPKNAEQERSHSETRSCENVKKDPLVDAQDCRDIDLSQFDVLSEIDENTSDDRDHESRTSSPRSRKNKPDSRGTGDRSESCAANRAGENDEGASKSKSKSEPEELDKVKQGNYDPASGSRNNPSAVSDSSLSVASSATLLIMSDTSKSTGKEKSERTIACDVSSERSGLGEKYSRRSNVSSDETRPEKGVERTESIYGPLLPPRFASSVSEDDEHDQTSPNESKIGDEVSDESRKSAHFIGPCLPPELNSHQSEEREDADTVTTEADAIFGPVLPPHLLQRQRDNDSRERMIGPMLPGAVKESTAALSESDDDCAIGPLPADHPALRNSRVHEQLDVRAQRIRDEGHLEEVDIGSKREEWMTELPSAQAANLGLGPRKFRVREGPDMSDRSCWTDTPAQKAQKQKDLERKRLNNTSESDKEHVQESRKKKADRSEKRERSLLEIHQSKIAKKKRKEEKEAKDTGISTRRPFDRDVDLQVTRFDQAQKKSILRKAQLLDDRFSRGQI